MPPLKRPARSLCSRSPRSSPCHNQEAGLGQSSVNTIYCVGVSLTSFCIDLAESVVAHLVHETVEHGVAALAVHSGKDDKHHDRPPPHHHAPDLPELPAGCVVVPLLDVCPLRRAAADPHHPQELVYIYNTNTVISCEQACVYLTHRRRSSQ